MSLDDVLAQRPVLRVGRHCHCCCLLPPLPLLQPCRGYCHCRHTTTQVPHLGTALPSLEMNCRACIVSRQPGGSLAGGGCWPALSSGRLFTRMSNTLHSGAREKAAGFSSLSLLAADSGKFSWHLHAVEFNSRFAKGQVAQLSQQQQEGGGCTCLLPAAAAATGQHTASRGTAGGATHLPIAGAARSGRALNSFWKASSPRAWCCIRIASFTCTAQRAQQVAAGTAGFNRHSRHSGHGRRGAEGVKSQPGRSGGVAAGQGRAARQDKGLGR